MRSSFAFARCGLSLVFLSLVSCAQPKPFPTPEPSVTLDGEVRLVGTSPLEQTIGLADAGGVFCTLSNPRLEYEFRNLVGHAVQATGRLLGKSANGPEFLVESYEMMPVDGFRPVIGAVTSRDGELFLVDARSGATYRLGGPLAEALRAFSGFKVWVSGPVASIGKGVGAGETITIRNYGVLVPVGSIIRPEP